MRTIKIFDDKDYETHWTKFKRDSARAIIFIKDKLLMVHSKKYGEYKFPGGGINHSETHIDALMREVKEETGYSLIPESIKEYGKTLIIRKGYNENEIFEQESFYFMCDVDEKNISAPKPDDGYETEYGYAPVLISPADAIAVDEGLLNIPEIPWTDRDLAVLRELQQKMELEQI